jgi:hypothetical protein
LLFVDHFAVYERHEKYSLIGRFNAKLTFFRFFRNKFYKKIAALVKIARYKKPFNFKSAASRYFGNIARKRAQKTLQIGAQFRSRSGGQ